MANTTELRAKRKGGDEFPVELSLARAEVARGSLPVSTLVIRDITERKKAEQALRQARDELEIRVQERTRELEETNKILRAEIAERKRAEETVKEERQRFNDALDMLPAYLVLLSPDYHVPFANRFFQERFGESHGKRCFEYLFGRSEPCETCETYTVLKTMAPHQWEWLGPDGRNYYVSDFPFTDTDGSTLIMEVGIDVTERKKAEEALLEAHGELEARVQERTRELEEASKVLQVEIADRKRAEENANRIAQEWKTTFDSIADLVSIQDANFKLVRVNRAYADAVKMRPEELTGRSCYSVVHGTACPTENCPHEQTLKTKQAVTREIFEPHLGVYLEVSTSPVFGESGEILGSVHIAKNITGRKQAEARLAYLASFPELNPVPVLELDAAGNVKYLNPAAKTRFPDLLVSGVAHPFLADWETVVKTILSDKRPSFVRDVNVGDSWFEQTVTYLPSNQHFRLYGRDITEHKQAEEEVRQRTLELEASNKELEAFAYSVSHDLRAPLRSMEGFSQALVEDYEAKLDGQGKQYLRYVQESSQLMARLIDDLLKISRVTRQEMYLDTVNLSDIAGSVVEGLKRMEPARELKVAIAPGLVCRGDARLLRIVFENLLGNAWKFTSKVTSTRIEVGAATRDGRKVWFVSDNGVGFDMTYADKLFQPFQRLHKSTEFPGTGIGLATVQRIIRRHGGEVWGEGRVGEGATFYFTLGQ